MAVPEERCPSLYRLLRPHPEPGEDPDNEDHEVLDHVDGEVGAGGRGGVVGGVPRRTRDLPRPVQRVPEEGFIAANNACKKYILRPNICFKLQYQMQSFSQLNMDQDNRKVSRSSTQKAKLESIA